LKQFHPSFVYNPNFRCEPTYEELKRNEREKRKKRRLGLRAYLWGIETIPEKTH